MSLLLISEILGFFANMLTAGDEYSFRNSESWQQPNQMQL